MRKSKKKSLIVLLLFIGVLIGYAGAMILPVRLAPEALPLPSEAQPPPDLRQQSPNPEENGQGKMIFQGYLGIYSGRIAIFSGQPPDGTLQYVTDYEVREDLREQLAAGVPFKDASELLALLENYTS
ncbi:MAG: BofC C-terminal domain-containing protein [Dethiobacter sp.]|nr:BofC C-terminal domain-containing protein [Dethiobacter sp.]MBS3983870.1 BofC C-terminal domain-containing protein [Dethiobacter sp.]MCL4462691.1 BofC C-terminal domain-containing protein [Bacillota bacterium]MCL5993802.1 BofC C-terminal domain-containing protein [Bacillota bacterium]